MKSPIMTLFRLVSAGKATKNCQHYKLPFAAHSSSDEIVVMSMVVYRLDHSDVVLFCTEMSHPS